MILSLSIASVQSCDLDSSTACVGESCDHIDESIANNDIDAIHIDEDNSGDGTDDGMNPDGDDDLSSYEDDEDEDLSQNDDDINSNFEDNDDEDISSNSDDDDEDAASNPEDNDEEDYNGEDDDDDDDEGYNDEDDEDEGSDFTNSFDYLKYKVFKYLDKFGTGEENWYMSEDFNKTYHSFLKDHSSYSLDEEDENYETHLKIYNSILSVLKEKNLTDEEANYLEFLVMYYLNNYANTTNYTWDDELDGFDKFMDDVAVTCMPPENSTNKDAKTSPTKSLNNSDSHLNNNLNDNKNAKFDGNSKISNDTLNNIPSDNITSVNTEHEENSWINIILNILRTIYSILKDII